MNFKEYFSLTQEAFDTISDLLMNPEYKDEWIQDVMRKFIDSGGTILGEGAFGKVLAHPSWKYVLKTFPDDPCYLKFIRLAFKNQDNPAFPKLYDKPRKIRPFFKRHKTNEFLYLVKMEKLIPLKSREEFGEVSMIMLGGIYKLQTLSNDINNAADYMKEYLLEQQKEAREYLQKHKEYINLIKAYSLVNKIEDCHPDIKMANFMRRPSTGDIVITDPIWFDKFASPFARHDHAMKMEIGAYEYENEDDSDRDILRGGERYKKPKKKKFKPAPKMPESDMPF